MTDTTIAQGRLSPVTWTELEAFGQIMSEFWKGEVSADKVVTSWTEAGELQLRWSDEAAKVRLSATGAETLQNLRDTLAHVLDSVRPGLAASLDWAAEDSLEGRLPSNFRLARVGSTSRLSANFLRLRLLAEDLDYMSRTGLHLRMLFPSDPQNPAWPRLSAAGRTVWPAPDLLHMPVYTVRDIDAAAGWLDVDVYLHGNGPTCEWAEKAKPGDTLGLTGPGGGWLPKSTTLCLGGDETALPVIARILETADPASTGHAIIEVGDAGDIQSIRCPKGIRLDWIIRGQAQPLRDAFTESALALIAASPGAHVFFGGEKADAQTIRPVLKAAPGAASCSITSAAYWAVGEDARAA